MAGGTLGTVSAILLAVATQIGSFAYYGAHQHISARLENMRPNELQLVQYRLPDRRPVTDYVAVDGSPVHVYLIRDDFRTFDHIAPAGRGNGRFTVPVHLDPNHRYYAFVDSFVGDGVGEQTLRFTLQKGAPPHHLDVTLQRPSSVSQAGPYRVTLSTARFIANTPVNLSARIMRGNHEVTPPRKQSFKAVAAVVNTSSLEYTGYYEGNAAGLVYPGEYAHPQLSLPPLPRGIYRMWLQLTIDHVRYTAPFTLAAE